MYIYVRGKLSVTYIYIPTKIHDYLTLGANPMSHFLAQVFFGN